MDNPERPAPADPPATHWNTSRDPAWSFACPYCGGKTRLYSLYIAQGVAHGLKHGDIIASCRHCEWACVQSEWEYLKAMELLQR